MRAVVDLLIAPDPVVAARAYLSRYVENVQGGVPPKWEWQAPLVVLRDGGGAGEYSRVLNDARITVEVSAPKRPDASRLARRVMALLRAWQDEAPGVYWRGVVAAPAYFPEDETGTPLYVSTVAVVFRATAETLDPL